MRIQPVIHLYHEPDNILRATSSAGQQKLIFRMWELSLFEGRSHLCVRKQTSIIALLSARWPCNAILNLYY